MLRRVLDAAEDAKAAAIEGEADIPGSESTSLVAQESDSSIRGYGSTAPKNHDDDDDDEEDLESQSYDDDDDEDSTSYTSVDPSQDETLAHRCWMGIRECFTTIANVDNLWDDSEGPTTRQNKMIVLFWFFVLASAYAGERSSFYLLVDRTGPFRMFSAVMITSSHALLLGLGMLISAIHRRNFEYKSLGIPIVDVGLMALLDISALLLALITAYHVPPTLTVILVQLTIPLTVFFTQFTHPDGKCRGTLCGSTDGTEEETPREEVPLDPDIDPSTIDIFNTPPLPGWGGYAKAHLWGSFLITLAVFLGLCPAFVALFEPDFFSYADKVPLRTAYNSIVFALACVPSAASQLYKEHVFLQHKQPVDATFLNLTLSIFQFIFILIVSPLVYTLQGMAAPGNWAQLYPSIQCKANFLDGLKCFFGMLDEETAKEGYAEPASCRFALPIVLCHVLSIVMVGVAVDKIVHAGATKVMYRGISIGIVLAVIAMLIYDLYDPDFNYGLPIDLLHCVCTFLLIVGSEVYHRVSVQDATFETVYPETHVQYDDDA